MTEPFCPSEFWNYKYCNEIDVNEKVLSGIKLKGKLFEELQNLYSTYLKSAVHPSLIKIIKELDEEESEEKESNKNTNNANKLEEEEDETEKKSIKEIVFNAIRIDQNTIKFLFIIPPLSIPNILNKISFFVNKIKHFLIQLQLFELLLMK